MRSRIAALAVIVTTACGCSKGSRATTGGGDAAPTDGGAPGSTASATPQLDAAPADDTIPAASSDELTARGRHLLEAISKNDPDLATDILFPRDGWLAVRDTVEPGKEWDKRIDRPFRRSVQVLSRHHMEGAQFVSLELGHAVVQESTLHKGWKKSLWTVHGTRLTYVVEGHTRTISIHELTGWRGAWYVTRLR
jgi:hypothetical protein